MKAATYITHSIFLLMVCAIAGLFLLPYVPIEKNIDLRIVESGSMEPAIMTGSLIVVRPVSDYRVGDVVMFESRFAEVPTTHRVTDIYVDAGKTWFVTKGDANEERDAEPVMAEKVLGKVWVDVPRVGFVLDFAQQPIGFLLLIVLPALLIVISEIEKIWRELRRNTLKRQQPKDTDRESKEPVVGANTLETKKTRHMIDIGNPVRYMQLPTLDLRKKKIVPKQRHDIRPLSQGLGAFSAFILCVLVGSSSLFGTTVSYFNDVELSTDNVFGAIALDVGAVPDGEVYNFTGSEIDDLDGAVVITASPESGSVLVQYDVVTNILSSTTTLCEVIEADAESPVSFVGPLASLAGTEVTFDVPWSIAFSLLSEVGLSDGDVCNAEIVLTAWHIDTDTNTGYFDEEIIPLTFTYSAPVSFAAFDSFSISAPAALALDGEVTHDDASSTEEMLLEEGQKDVSTRTDHEEANKEKEAILAEREQQVSKRSASATNSRKEPSQYETHDELSEQKETVVVGQVVANEENGVPETAHIEEDVIEEVEEGEEEPDDIVLEESAESESVE